MHEKQLKRINATDTQLFQANLTISQFDKSQKNTYQNNNRASFTPDVNFNKNNLLG